MELALLVLYLMIAGALAGFLAGLLGVGGGIVLVPILFSVLEARGIASDLAMKISVASSMTTIIATSIQSVRAHIRRGAVDTAFARSMVGWVLLGAALGTLAATSFGGEMLILVFAFVAGAMAIYMGATSEDVKLRSSVLKGIGGGTLMASIGMVSAMMGIGGGTLCVPYLQACGRPIHISVATASVFGLVIAIPATCIFLAFGWEVGGRPTGSLGYVNMVAVALIIPFTAITAPIGASVAHRLKPDLLRKVFAGFLLLTSIRMAAPVILLR